eukprot:scaffold21307_cov66-Phaeocystis_antarctica.AAC.5
MRTPCDVHAPPAPSSGRPPASASLGKPRPVGRCALAGPAIPALLSPQAPAPHRPAAAARRPSSARSPRTGRARADTSGGARPRPALRGVASSSGADSRP